VAYTYDNLYRLTSETIANDVVGVNGSLGYQYDAVGNRQQMASTLMPLPSGLWNYDANDRLTTDTYDNDGNTVSRAGIANTYDFENHLASWGYITYVYDGDGNRVAKTIGGVTTNYLVDTLNPTGYAQVLDELQSSAVVRSYAWGLQLVSQSQLVAAVPPASPWQTSYYGFDGHGSVRFLTNSTGAVTDTYTYDAFGNLIESTGTTANNYLFAGEQFDPDINLYYNRARYLDVRVGRFWGMDTDEGDDTDPISLHKYLYAEADPVDGLDPSGNDDIGAIGMSETFDAMSTVMPSAVTHPLAYTTFHVAAFAAALDANAKRDLNPKDKNFGKSKAAGTSVSYCGHYVSLALAAGGIQASSPTAAGLGPVLTVLGFAIIATGDPATGYTHTTGDITIFQASPEHGSGHAEGYDGSAWVSDFIQKRWNPYRQPETAGTSAIYRYPLIAQ
jgi:RHS repeat-associated protein